MLWGRYWPAQGPQQTLYIPGPLLLDGTNELVLLEVEAAPPEPTGAATVCRHIVFPSCNLDMFGASFLRELVLFGINSAPHQATGCFQCASWRSAVTGSQVALKLILLLCATCNIGTFLTSRALTSAHDVHQIPS